MATVKRKCQTEDAGDEEKNDDNEEAIANGEPEEKRRRVEFQDVTIYNFNRRQGYVCVPSQVIIYPFLTTWVQVLHKYVCQIQWTNTLNSNMLSLIPAQASYRPINITFYTYRTVVLFVNANICF